MYNNNNMIGTIYYTMCYIRYNLYNAIAVYVEEVTTGGEPMVIK